MGECKICQGHGYYYIHADAAGTANDKKKVCKACWGTGLGDGHEEKAERIVRTRDAIVANIATKEQRPECDVKDGAWLMHEIATALASAESDLIKRMMKPSHALIVAVNNLSLDSDDDGRRLNIGIWLEGHHAMLRAFAKENNIDLEVEDVDG